MDFNGSWSKVGQITKNVSGHWTDALNVASPLCAPFAARWDEEADRRAKLRTPENLKSLMDAQRNHNAARATSRQASAQRRMARKASRNPLSTTRRAARTADKAATAHQRQTHAALKTARRSYPATMRQLALRLHAVHAVPAVGVSVLLSDGGHLTVWPAMTSAALAALNALVLKLGRRTVTAPVEDGLSAEEQQLMGRLDPSYWVQHAADRGLSGTVTTPPQIGPGGITTEVRLDGTWTVKTFRDKVDSVRALLGARTALRIRITSASRGGWAVMSLATRSATDGTSSLWTPERIPADAGVMSLGQDTETGEEVLVPFDERLLISGASGTGKSWSFRPLLATAHLRGDLLFIDGKGEEANVWDGICRCATEPAEIAAAIDEAWDEMDRRRRDMKARGISVWDGDQLTVVIDEGQVALATLKLDKSEDGKARLQRLRELSSLGRSRGVVLWWATQYPVTDGSAPGVDQLVAPNLLTRFSLRVAGTTQSQVALDDCAHYAPHQIPEGKEWRGHGYLKGYGPRIIRTWTLDDAGVRKLPAKHWGSEERPAARPTLTLVKAVPAARTEAPALTDAETAVMNAVRAAAGPVRQADVVAAAGLAKGTVSKVVKRLTDAGHLVRSEDGTLTATQAGEVSA